MKKLINDFLCSLQNALNNDKCEKTTVNKDGIHAEYTTGKDYWSLSISYEGSSNLDEEIPTKQEQQKNTEECSKLRNDFKDYIQSIDRHIFRKACQRFKKGELYDLHNDIMYGQLDSETLANKIKIFKDAINQAIMDTIVQLKSQMN